MRRFDKKQNILEANLILEHRQLINSGVITEQQLNELKEFITEEGDDPILINEVVTLGVLGIGLSIGKGIEALGIVFRKLYNFFAGKGKMKKTKAEKFGEKYHKKIIKFVAWLLKKAGLGEYSEFAANVIFWLLIAITIGFGSIPSDWGLPMEILKKMSTLVKKYEIAVLVISAILWVKFSKDIKKAFGKSGLEGEDFPKVVHSTEICIEDKGMKDIMGLGKCALSNLTQEGDH